MKRKNKHVYAIIRIDEFHGETASWPNRVTVKEILWDEEEAKKEVDRLNRLNAQKDCQYFFQMTRLVERES